MWRGRTIINYLENRVYESTDCMISAITMSDHNEYISAIESLQQQLTAWADIDAVNCITLQVLSYCQTETVRLALYAYDNVTQLTDTILQQYFRVCVSVLITVLRTLKHTYQRIHEHHCISGRACYSSDCYVMHVLVFQRIRT